jgi:hypothetical protein
MLHGRASQPEVRRLTNLWRILQDQRSSQAIAAIHARHNKTARTKNFMAGLRGALS